VPDSLRFLNAGEVVGGKYSIVQTVGCGGMGVVYEAKHLRLGHSVAIKMLLPDLAQEEEAVTRFDREARAAAQLQSLHATHVFDVDTLDDGTPYIVMEFLHGRDLADELAERGPLPIGTAVDYVLQACDAMSEAHRLGIVHRDLKPSNLFLVENGQSRIVKVLDFGISKITDDNAPGVTTTRSGLGTAVYMSPEQVRAAKHVDARSDVWALGVVLYEMLTGCQPFAGATSTAVLAAIVADAPEPLRRLREAIPAELERVVMKALEKDRDRRFRDAAAFAAAIAPFASRSPGDAAPRTVRDATPTLKSGPLEEAIARGPAPGPSPAGPATAPGWTKPDAVRSARPRALWITALLALGMVLALLVLGELFPRSRAPSAGSPAQVLAAQLPPAPSAPSLPTVPQPSETTLPTSKQEPLPTATARPRETQSRKSVQLEPHAAPVETKPPSAGGTTTDPSPSGSAPRKPLTRKNAAGLPDDPG
jgi:serine/threonine-protein kinase